ncbi:MAG: metal-binding protein [Peptococcaceae bacterium BICA1-7]|nr:MAG: metal-binding protein [Peptococcaceae bacterium BICA1-7]HBV99174.1 metal-binding protein [Desulfotomaculum sp.]
MCVDLILPYLNCDPQEKGPQYLEDIATGYWYSEALFTAVELDIFTLLEGGKTAEEIAAGLDLNRAGLERFLQALCALGLIGRQGGVYFNTNISRRFLVKGEEDYQGDSILWRKKLFPGWRSLEGCLRKGGRVDFAAPDENPEQLAGRIRQYSRAMDCVARAKVEEILPFFKHILLSGEILDVGSGSGAVSAGFLENYPGLRAILMDLQEVLDCAGELLGERGCHHRIDYCPANILEPWPVQEKGFDLIILSNIVHAYSEVEITELLEKAAACLKKDGFLLIHDFFFDHCPGKAALFDLNMFVNTYNGRVYPAGWLKDRLTRQKLYPTELLPLTSDTALIIAGKSPERLSGLCLDSKIRLIARIKDLGFQSVCPLPAEAVHIPEWADLRCRFGCDNFGKPHCPPNSPTPEKTREIFRDYTHCLLLEGSPPTGDFQRLVLRAEKEAFKAGFYKALAFWAGPCAICDICSPEGSCRNTRDSRPSMEGSGIDVFETVKRAGFSLRTLAERGDFIKYFGILLLE